MTPYLVVVILVSFFSFGMLLSRGKLRVILTFLNLLVLSSLYYFRDYSIGTDTIEYVHIFNNLNGSKNIVDLIENAISWNLELGFSILVYFLGVFGNHFILFILAMMVYANIGYVILKSKLNPVSLYMALFTYVPFYLNAFNFIRQVVAISFVVLASYFLLKSNRKLFFLFIFLGVIFHYTAMVALLFYFVYRFRDFLSKYTYTIVLFVFLISKFILDFIFSLYDKYTSYMQADTVSSTLSPLLFSMFFFIYLFALIFKSKILKYKSEFKFFLILYSIFIGLQFFLYSSPYINQGLIRISFYFSWPAMFLVAILIYNMKVGYLRVLVSVAVYGFLFLFFLYSFSKLGVEMVPFKFSI